MAPVDREEVDLLATRVRALIDLLDDAGESHWRGRFAGALQRIAAGDPYAVERILEAYGGMGSFTDFVLHPVNGHALSGDAISQANDELASLSEAVHRSASEIRRRLRQPPSEP